MKKTVIIDLAALLFVFTVSWYFKKFLPVELRGASVVISTGSIALAIMKLRGISFLSIGFNRFSFKAKFVSEVLRISFMIFALQFIGILVFGSIFGNPDPGSAIDNQPQKILGFVLDIVLTTWVITGLGEEFIFRGIVLNRVKELFGDVGISNIYLISALQAIWFGLAHQSQGISGMLITGLIGFSLGVYFLKRRESGLWPLVVAHGLVDTLVLTINFFS